MEFAIIAGLAFIGYTMNSAPEVESHYTNDDLSTGIPYPSADISYKELERMNRVEAEKRWKDSFDPGRTGVVNSAFPMNQQPFYSSVAKQNTSERVKQTRMEMFTGATDLDTSQTGTYRTKRELETFFSPTIARVAVTSGGSGGNPLYEAHRPYVSGIQNNVLPAEQTQVGRGVGVGTDVPASGGFHWSYRATPKNVNAYKKNNLPGRINPGVSRISKLTEKPVVSVRRPDTYWEMQRRPLAEGKFAGGADAPMRHANEPRLMNGTCGGHYVGEETYGNPACASNQRINDKATDATRPLNNRNRNQSHHDQLNLTGDKASHASTSWDCSRFASQQRGETSTYKSNLKGPDGHMAPSGVRTNVTHREHSSDHFGALGTYVESGTMEWKQKPANTLRDLVNHSAFGDAAPILPAQERQGADKQLLRHAKRSEQLVGVMNPPLLRKSDVRATGQVTMTKHEGMVKQAAMPSSFVPQARQGGVGHLTTSFNKLPAQNPRVADLGLARRQLATNEFAVSIA